MWISWKFLPVWKISPLLVDFVWVSKQTLIFPGLLNSWFTANYIKHTVIIALSLCSAMEAQLKTNLVKYDETKFEIILYYVPGNWALIKYYWSFYYKEAWLKHLSKLMLIGAYFANSSTFTTSPISPHKRSLTYCY